MEVGTCVYQLMITYVMYVHDKRMCYRICIHVCLQTSATLRPPSPFFEVPKRCVVTGGLGFVGQRLVETLVKRGAEQEGSEV